MASLIKMKIDADRTIKNLATHSWGRDAWRNAPNVKRWVALVARTKDTPGGLERVFLKGGALASVSGHDLEGKFLEMAAKAEYPMARGSIGSQFDSVKQYYRVESVEANHILVSRIGIDEVGVCSSLPQDLSANDIFIAQLQEEIEALKAKIAVLDEGRAKAKNIVNRITRRVKKIPDLPTELVAEFVGLRQVLGDVVKNDGEGKSSVFEPVAPAIKDSDNISASAGDQIVA